MFYSESKYNVIIDEDYNGKILLYNTVTGAVTLINKNIYNTFHNKQNVDGTTLSPELIRLGYVVQSEFDETSKLEFYKKCYIFNSEPHELFFVIAPTLACNYRCEYCFEKAASSSCTMSDTTWHNLLAFFKKQCFLYPKIDALRITWFGGEPLLQFNQIRNFSKEIISFCNENDIIYSAFIVTNGSLLDKETASILRKECNVSEAQITFDGLKAKYESQRHSKFANFDSVVQNIKDSVDIIKFHIRINVDSNNQSDIKPLVKYLLADCNLSQNCKLYFAPIKPYNSAPSEQEMSAIAYEQFREELVDFIISIGCEKTISTTLPKKVATACGAMRNYTCVIGPKGELYRCEHCLGMPEWEIGDILQGFKRNNSDMCFLCEETPTKCKNCNLLPVCAGGCSADRLLHGMSFSCDAYLERIKFNVKLAIQQKQANSNGSCASHCPI